MSEAKKDGTPEEVAKWLEDLAKGGEGDNGTSMATVLRTRRDGDAPWKKGKK